ncbi:MAG TPA: AsmA family protein, partial [Albitalea sp.]|nr:AsmA family protein [Albitalea sp.]
MSIVAPVSAAAPAPRSRRASVAARMRWMARALTGLVLVAWSLLLIAWLTLHWGILPHIAQWRPQIEAHATRVLGVAVHIGNIQVRSGGWIPSVELRDVVLHDHQGRPALELPRVVAAVSARSLLALELRFEQLLIEGAHLEARRDAQGRLFVAGL